MITFYCRMVHFNVKSLKAILLIVVPPGGLTCSHPHHPTVTDSFSTRQTCSDDWFGITNIFRNVKIDNENCIQTKLMLANKQSRIYKFVNFRNQEFCTVKPMVLCRPLIYSLTIFLENQIKILLVLTIIT